MFHKHKWIKIKETYAPSASEMGWNQVDRGSQKIIMGVTTILWECEICHKIRKEEMLGKEITGTDID